MKKTLTEVDLPLDARKRWEKERRIEVVREKFKNKKKAADLSAAEVKELTWALAERAGLVKGE